MSFTEFGVAHTCRCYEYRVACRRCQPFWDTVSVEVGFGTWSMPVGGIGAYERVIGNIMIIVGMVKVYQNQIVHLAHAPIQSSLGTRTLRTSITRYCRYGRTKD